MTSLRKAAGSLRRPVLKVGLPFEEQLSAFLFIGRTWTSLGSTPMRLAQAVTSAFSISAGTTYSRGSGAEGSAWVTKELA